MLNLGGARTNGARDETELFMHVGMEPDRLAALYLMVIEAARSDGLDSAAVPVFLGWLTVVPELQLIGQEEIGTRELDLAVATSLADVRAMEAKYGFSDRETTRIIEQCVRLGQHCFANRVLAIYQHRCGVCGLDARPLAGHRLLVASRIKPWA